MNEKKSIRLNLIGPNLIEIETDDQDNIYEQAIGRINPQLSCTITPEDKKLLNELSLFACNKEKKMLNTSVIIRALIRFGYLNKDKLNFKETNE